MTHGFPSHDADDAVLSILRELVEHGADINLRGYMGRTALMWAALDDRPDIALYLIGRGAKIDSRDDFGETALTLATGCTSTVMQALLSKGANINSVDFKGDTALMSAVGSSNATMVRFLLSHGARVGIRNENGDTAADWSGNPEIIRMLRRGRE